MQQAMGYGNLNILNTLAVFFQKETVIGKRETLVTCARNRVLT